MTKTAWYRIVLVLIAVGLIGVLDLVMTQNQIANPFLVWRSWFNTWHCVSFVSRKHLATAELA
ncbi:hypothetical protein Lpp37_01896 [Lacticaseibacillus paracasei subsp. paracasei Lpp37]|nr:hypothetical protein Lpp37_01896 [Lacticaseibacillus paracasei subsp. paracasei Lpp37]